MECTAVRGLYVFVVYALLVVRESAAVHGQSQQYREKRQIFREQVLPHSGGKIPEDAFRTDRLALNRLNKEGIAIPDGVLLETRHREAHFSSHRHDPDIDASIIRLVQRPDGRYAPPEGRYPFNNLVESTYVIRPPINLHGYSGLPPRKPVQATLQLPARPFFAPPEELLNIGNLDSIDLLNTLNQEFPGTRLWTGFGPLFHETANRILRHSGSKQLQAKRGNAPNDNQLVRQGIGAGVKQGQKTEVSGLGSTKSTTTQVFQSNNGIIRNTPKQVTLQPSVVGQQQTTKGTAVVSPTVTGQIVKLGNPNNGGVRLMQLVNGVLTPMNDPRTTKKPVRLAVQPLRPGPGHSLTTHLTAPPLGYTSLDRIPKTSFTCNKAVRQMDSDPQTNCQVFHLCHPDGRKESFLCPVGSRYDPKTNLCSPWTSVKCPADP